MPGLGLHHRVWSFTVGRYRDMNTESDNVTILGKPRLITYKQ